MASVWIYLIEHTSQVQGKFIVETASVNTLDIRIRKHCLHPSGKSRKRCGFQYLEMAHAIKSTGLLLHKEIGTNGQPDNRIKSESHNRCRRGSDYKPEKFFIFPGKQQI